MSFEDLLKRADQGDADAQYEVGTHHNVHENYPQALEYYQLSANQNHPKALNRVGLHHFHGNSVQQNYNKAFKYFLLSAERKCVEGYGNVGHCYEMGHGVDKDLKKALEYYYLWGNQSYINVCECLILKQFSETLNETDYVYAYPLYVKHNHKDLNKLKTLLNDAYAKVMHFMPSVLSNIIISFLL